MAGWFGLFDMTKPGKGVDKEEPKKKGLFLFSELFARKFFSYIKLNMLYLATCVPAISVLWVVLVQILGGFLGDSPQEIAGAGLLALVFALFVTLLYSLSPFSAGYYYVLRNFVREDHAWVLADFFGRTKANLKNSLLLYGADLVFLSLAMLALRLYVMLAAGGITLMQVLLGLFLVVLTIYEIMTPYKWIMLVTFDLKLGEVLKNALYLTLGDLRRTLLYLLVTVLYIVIFYSIVQGPFLLGMILMALFGFSLYGLIQTMTVYPVIEKSLIRQGEWKV